MRSFKEHMEAENLDERIVRKGTVAVYATKVRRHGNDAVKNYDKAKRLLTTNISSKTSQEKIDIIIASLTHICDGLISNRQQIGSVSAQITATAVL